MIDCENFWNRSGRFSNDSPNEKCCISFSNEPDKAFSQTSLSNSLLKLQF